MRDILTQYANWLGVHSFRTARLSSTCNSSTSEPSVQCTESDTGHCAGEGWSGTHSAHTSCYGNRSSVPSSLPSDSDTHRCIHGRVHIDGTGQREGGTSVEGGGWLAYGHSRGRDYREGVIIIFRS